MVKIIVGRCVGRFIGIQLGIGVVGEVESGDDG